MYSFIKQLLKRLHVGLTLIYNNLKEILTKIVAKMFSDLRFSTEMLLPTNEVAGIKYFYTCLSVHGVGGIVPSHNAPRDRTPPPNHKSGRNTSYWNAFLFQGVSYSSKSK